MESLIRKTETPKETFRELTDKEREGIASGKLTVTIGESLKEYAGMRVTIHNPDGTTDSTAAAAYLFLYNCKLIKG